MPLLYVNAGTDYLSTVPTMKTLKQAFKSVTQTYWTDRHKMHTFSFGTAVQLVVASKTVWFAVDTRIPQQCLRGGSPIILSRVLGREPQY